MVGHLPAIVAFLGYDPTPEGVTVGGRLRVKRRALGLSQETAAKRLGIDEGTLRRYETGEWEPKGSRLERIYRFIE